MRFTAFGATRILLASEARTPEPCTANGHSSMEAQSRYEKSQTQSLRDTWGKHGGEDRVEADSSVVQSYTREEPPLLPFLGNVKGTLHITSPSAYAQNQQTMPKT